MRLAAGPRCYKKEWGDLTVKVKLNTEMPETGELINVQILTDQLLGRNQFQDVPKTSLLPLRPTHVKQQVMIISGHAKGDLGSVVHFNGDSVKVGPLKGKATARNSVEHPLAHVAVISCPR